VHQNTLTIPFTALRSLLASLYHITLATRFPGHPPSFDVLLLNGPGTCFVLCMVVYVNRVGPLILLSLLLTTSDLQFLGLPSPRLVYVETFARVRTLSQTGKLLRPMVDRYVLLFGQCYLQNLDFALDSSCNGPTCCGMAGVASAMAGLFEQRRYISHPYFFPY
jgi:beta-1,4-N-acetylglucosaminyltransferase